MCCRFYATRCAKLSAASIAWKKLWLTCELNHLIQALGMAFSIGRVDTLRASTRAPGGYGELEFMRAPAEVRLRVLHAICGDRVRFQGIGISKEAKSGCRISVPLSFNEQRNHIVEAMFGLPSNFLKGLGSIPATALDICGPQERFT